jgi:hypothetical protein
MVWAANMSMIDHERITGRIMDDANKPAADGETKEMSKGTEESDVTVDSVTLARLLEEVRNGNSFAPGAYNRVHNRHNR